MICHLVHGQSEFFIVFKSKDHSFRLLSLEKGGLLYLGSTIPEVSFFHCYSIKPQDLFLLSMLQNKKNKWDFVYQNKLQSKHELFLSNSLKPSKGKFVTEPIFGGRSLSLLFYDLHRLCGLACSRFVTSP